MREREERECTEGVIQAVTVDLARGHTGEDGESPIVKGWSTAAAVDGLWALADCGRHSDNALLDKLWVLVPDAWGCGQIGQAHCLLTAALDNRALSTTLGPGGQTGWGWEAGRGAEEEIGEEGGKGIGEEGGGRIRFAVEAAFYLSCSDLSAPTQQYCNDVAVGCVDVAAAVVVVVAVGVFYPADQPLISATRAAVSLLYRLHFTNSLAEFEAAAVWVIQRQNKLLPRLRQSTVHSDSRS
ncbi:hypothetical protein EGW08_012766 [Elysia chlorotica]|uniref:Uncharacterized protein n=1 Tax=Elysia chlorotica TaxID=188477 RepID=A0A3S1HHI3_ELYCH|nr:hypothetical protein EGW08_012766 [Elysia chlorotica]